jgi:hypothetical protein
MEFPPEHYFQTAAQRIRQAQHLYEAGASFALAIYVGGLAVECLLRAYKGRRDPTFDERHDLARLFKASGMLDIDPDMLRAKQWTDEQIESHLGALRVAANIIFQMWSNTYRFASEERLRSHLKKATGYRKIKGDYLKEQTRQFLNAAQSFMNKGVVQWQA